MASGRLPGRPTVSGASRVGIIDNSATVVFVTDAGSLGVQFWLRSADQTGAGHTFAHHG